MQIKMSRKMKTQDYDHVVFDTAPTGHTLRLLQLPAAWNQFLNINTSGTSCLGPLSGLRERHALYAKTLQCLADSALTQVALVSRAERSALAEAERTRSELAAQSTGSRSPPAQDATSR